MPNIGPMELIVVLVIALLILGPKRLPAAGKSLGRGITEFKEGLTSHRDAPAQVETAAAPAAPVAPEQTEAGATAPEPGEKTKPPAVAA